MSPFDPRPEPIDMPTMHHRRAAPSLLLLALACAPAATDEGNETVPARAVVVAPTLEPQRSGTTALLQAVSAVSAETVWVSGHAGTYARTVDGGATWSAARVPGADSLQFRDVHAASADVAWLLSAGPGALSRIYHTRDGGRSWTEQFRASEPEAFLDCFAFWDDRRGIAFGDAVGGAHYVLVTGDGGATWERVPADRLPPALPGEGSFAASGTCVAVAGEGRAWIGTGNASVARVLHTLDGGHVWTAADTEVASGEAAGFASVAFRDSLRGAALGGEIGKPGARGDYVAVTENAGRSWTLGGRPTFAGAVYGAAYARGLGAQPLVAVGPGGAALSRDDGRTWTPLDSAAYWSVGFGSPERGWMVGPGGRIVLVRFR